MRLSVPPSPERLRSPTPSSWWTLWSKTASTVCSSSAPARSKTRASPPSASQPRPPPAVTLPDLVPRSRTASTRPRIQRMSPSCQCRGHPSPECCQRESRSLTTWQPGPVSPRVGISSLLSSKTSAHGARLALSNCGTRRCLSWRSAPQPRMSTSEPAPGSGRNTSRPESGSAPCSQRLTWNVSRSRQTRTTSPWNKSSQTLSSRPASRPAPLSCPNRQHEASLRAKPSRSPCFSCTGASVGSSTSG